MPAGEVVAPAAAARARLFGPVGVGRHQGRHSLAQERVDGVVLPVAGVGQHDRGRFGDDRVLELAQRRLGEAGIAIDGDGAVGPDDLEAP
jgi:hypothetical protein